MDDGRRPLQAEIIVHRHPVFQDILDDDGLTLAACRPGIVATERIA